jgi:hypothetical protein
MDFSGFRHSLATSFFSQFLLSRSSFLRKTRRSNFLQGQSDSIRESKHRFRFLDRQPTCLAKSSRGWVTWYNRVAKTYLPTWETIGITDALSLSLSPLEKNENLLKTIGYFWSDALNCFLFGHGPMTPTLLDVVMITGLNISSSCPSAYRLSVVPFKLSSKTECTN